MDCAKIGRLIYTLRTERKLTQQQLADCLNISGKAVSKWERGLGCPDVSLLSELSEVLEVDLKNLLSGEININDYIGGNMKNIKFYCCPVCGNIITEMSGASISCCGKVLHELMPQKTDESEKLSVELIDGEYFISSEHEMSKEHYISFSAFVNGESIFMRRHYPEWNFQTYVPRRGHGKLFWYCTRHGLFYQFI